MANEEITGSIKAISGILSNSLDPKIPLKQINQKEALIVFKEWELKEDKIKY